MDRSLALVGGTTVKSYTYEAAGRTKTVTSSAGTTTLSYDYEDRVSSITYPSSSANTFTYNGLDTRVGKVDSSGTATFKRDGADVTDPVLSDGSALYTPGVSERRGSATSFDHKDYLGTVSRQTNSSQSTTATRQYDAFGMLVSSSGTTQGPFGFAGVHGYQEDADSGLKLLGHRYYDPSTGRFLTRDPAKDGRNWYSYCDNEPTIAVDPDGLDETKATRDGRAWHAVIEDYYKKHHPKSHSEVKLPTGRADIVDVGRSIVAEIKPDTERKFKEGYAQLKRYAEPLEYDLGIVILYPPSTNPADYKNPIGHTRWVPCWIWWP